MKNLYTLGLTVALICFFQASCSQPLHQKNAFSKQDTLRGSITPERSWWDVLHYDVSVIPDYSKKSIHGITTITFKVLVESVLPLQVDLQYPLQIDSIWVDGEMIKENPAFISDISKNFHFIKMPGLQKGTTHTIKIAYHGIPKEATNPPWDGGWIWKKDEQNRPWMSVACQGLGASAWYPCKDHQSDEPDLGATLSIRVKKEQVAVGNGRLKEKIAHDDETITWTWQINNPINNYNIIPYIGNYVQIHDEYTGENGKKLTLDYWVLDYNKAKAQKQFEQVKPMLNCFENWFGPYPFYNDGFKLVESPHLGMEHQSAIAYGNGYMNGYRGRDLSETGWGKKWDFILVHESGHEWFGNNITTRDIADMWVHEGFTSYSETLLTECLFGKNAANEYVQGIRLLIDNDKPIIAPYNVHQEGSGDMYYKGSNLIHMIRQMINDDSKFKSITRDLNKTFYHKTVNGAEIEKFITDRSGIDFSKIFDQYLRTTDIPVLEYKIDKNKISYRWVNAVKGFNLKIKIDTGKETWLSPSSTWKTFDAGDDYDGKKIKVDKNFYIQVRQKQ